MWLRYRESLCLVGALALAPIVTLLYGAYFGLLRSNPLWSLGDLPTFVWLVLFSPLIEELTFRGIIQEWWYAKSQGTYLFLPLSIANLLTSLLFALIHLVYHAPFWALLVFFPSLLFGYCKERYDSIYPPILLHSVYNWIYFALIEDGVLKGCL